ncbi:MAG: hypothetical protein V4623_08290 [Pseudomonadota bacterium]
MDKNDESKTAIVTTSCFATKVKLQLSPARYTELTTGLLNVRTLNSDWIKAKGWEACFISDADMMGFFASSLMRYSRARNIQRLYAADTLDIFKAYRASLDVRCVPLNFMAFGQILFSSSKDCQGIPDADFLQAGAFSSLAIFPQEDELSFVILRDYSTCVTVAGPNKFIEHMVALSRRTWFDGVPFDGAVPKETRVRLPALSRREWFKSFRSSRVHTS